jgi:phosphatidylinositol glycan class U
MPVDRRKLAIFVGASALRLILFAIFPSLPDLLTSRVEISTPVSSFKRLEEGLFLYTRHVSPYDGGVFHQAPLLLPIFSLVPSGYGHTFATIILYALADMVNANSLIKIADSRESVSGRLHSTLRRHLRWDGVSIAAWYLFNPFTIATCLSRSTTVFTTMSTLYAISSCISGNSVHSMLALGVASYLSLYPALLLPPLVLLGYDRRITAKADSLSLLSYSISNFLYVVASIAGLLVASYVITGFSWEFIRSTYGFQLLVPDLTPNAGLWWYFFIEIFDPFREFFLGVFWLHLTGYVGGLTIRLRRQPLFVITALIGIFAIFKPYPSVADVSLYFALLPLYRHLSPLMRYTFFSSAALLYATLLGPAFYHLWIYAGSGNANFFYAITLVWSLSLSIIVADSIFAALRDEWEQENPSLKGKLVRQI